MRILVISESINVEDSSASKGRVALIHSLIQAGYSLKVLHYSGKEIPLKGIDTVLIRENKWSLWFVLSRLIRILQRYTKVYFNHKIEGIFGFSFTHTNDTKSITNAIKKAQSFQPNLILTLSKGGSFRPHRAMLRLPDLQEKWISYIHDPYPFHRYPRPYNYVESSYKAKEKLMKDITEKSRFLAFPSQLLLEWMQSYFPAVAGKSYVIPHQIKIEENLPEVPDFFQSEQFSLLHAGNLLAQRNPMFLIKAFLNFLQVYPEAKAKGKLYFVGDYSNHEVSLKPYLNHPNIIIVGHTEYAKVQALEKVTAVNIILEAISEISPFLPGKFPNCIKADRPILILGPYYSEVKRLMGKEYPYWAEANDEKEIQKQIEALYKHWIKDRPSFRLNRPDLMEYCEAKEVKKVIDTLVLK